MSGISGLGVIENAGPNHLRGFLKDRLKTSTSVDIAVAFVTQVGLAQLLPTLKKASMRGPVRFLTGLYQCFTEPEALESLLAEQIDTKGRLSVRLSTDPRFHWKAYFLSRGKTVSADLPVLNAGRASGEQLRHGCLDLGRCCRCQSERPYCRQHAVVVGGGRGALEILSDGASVG